MSTEPTRGFARILARIDWPRVNADLWAAASGRRPLSQDYRLPAISETPRQPAESSPEPPSGPERGTGEPEAHRGAEAIEGLANEFSPSLAEIAAWANAARREIDAAHFDIKTAIERIAKTMRPIHLHEAAASLRAIADHMPDTASARELRPGIAYAATLLGHTADDEGDGDG